MKNFFTADDWGLSQEINRGILSLVQQKKIQRVSILINGPELDFLFSDLLAEDIEFSLHLNFTEGVSLGTGYSVLTDTAGCFRGLNSFYKRPHLYRSLLSEMTNEAELQIKKATLLFGKRLVELDGHHHIHLYPGLLQKIKWVLLQHGIFSVRVPLDWEHPASAFMGSWLWLQKKSFSELNLLKYGYFSPKKVLSSKFQYYLCHPAIGCQKNDPMKERREQEFKRLKDGRVQ